jgi:sigma-B regulation protein RsbU (phosphoserine phosphatase)
VQTAPLPSPSPDARKKLRILIVDDSPMQLQILRIMLARWGFEISEAQSGDEALALCRESPPDMIISDWIMPGMSGPDLCRAFRALPIERYGYFILLTSKREKADVTTGLEAGADDFLSKPVSTLELRARLSAGRRVIGMERALNEKNRELQATLAELRHLHQEIDHDLQQARTIQQALVPERSRVVGRSRVSLFLQPCGHVGGDLVGMFFPGDERMGLYGIDVSGHGITSAMVTARVAGYLSSSFHDQNLGLERRFDRYYSLRPPHAVAAALNQRLAADPGVDSYLTMAYVAADLSTGRMRMVQAGHPPPLLLRADGSMRFIGEGGLPIGLFPDVEYETVEFTMKPGDRLLIYSDGFTEAVTKSGEMLGEDGLIRLFRASADIAEGEELLQDLFWRLGSELSAVELGDDVSAALLEFDVLNDAPTLSDDAG